MKKLLSICFLSILLGFLSFSTQAQQSNTGSSCASGFWIENLQPTTIHEIGNLPADMPNTGDLPLTHTLGQLWWGSTGQYLTNAHPGQTELYELHFCNTCGLDPKTKVSIDWLVIRDGDTINDNLSDYMELSIYTFYNQLNQYGACQSIGWLGGRVNDGFGYCEPVPGSYTLYDSIHGLNTGCHVPTNYPGALQVTQGTPESVMTQLGQIVPAMGLNHVYSEALDYFYLDFFMQTRNIVQIKWKQIGDYKLVMRIRERVGGTPYMNLNWNNNETTDFIGGHQSCCGNVIAEDVIGFPTFGSVEKAVCQQVTWTFGRPDYTFNGDNSDRSYDTNIVFGQYVFDNTDCKYFQVDSIYYVDFFVRHTPVVTVHDQTLCKCDNVDILSSVTEDLVGLNDTQSSKRLEWWYNNKWNTIMRYRTYAKIGDDSVYYFRVRQVNTYDDTLECEGPQADFTITIKEMVAPQINVPSVVDFCREALNGVTLTATATLQDNCGTTVRWYTSLDGIYQTWLEDGTLTPANYFTSYIKTSTLLSGATLSVNLADYMPSTNKDTTIYFFAVSYNEAQQCSSRKFDYFAVTIHQTPELAPHIIKTAYCPGSEVEMQVTVNNNPNLTDVPYYYVWGGDITSVILNGTTTGTKVPYAGPADKTIGSSTSTTTYFPFYNARNYCYSQQIYTKEEIGAGLITKIAFYNNNANITRNNVTVSFAETTVDNFGLSGNTWVKDGLTQVYSGTVSATQAGWVTITLDNPYMYDGTKNLVVAVNDESNTTANAKFRVTNTPGSSPSYYKAMYVSNANNPVGPTGSGNRVATRNNIQFTIESLQASTKTNQYGYYQMDDNDSCHTTYHTTAYVIDGNGCTSQPVEFNYMINDTVNPTVSQSTVTTQVYACHLDINNAPVYTTVAALEAGAHITFNDNCDKKFLKIASVNSVTTSSSDTTCVESLTRTYIIKDHCGNPVTFTQVFVTVDTTRPYFYFAPGAYPFVRLNPVEGGNCTFNSPDSMDFVNAIAPLVRDNCTDSAYLMSTVKFFWENTTESPINGKDIFKQKNHLSVVAQITDRCGNVRAQDIIFLDRPEKISIKPNGITSTGNQCFGDTATLHFNVDYIVDDTVMGPFVPYTYEWIEENDRPVTFTAATDTTTDIIFPGTGDYNFKIKVTDRNGCVAFSDLVLINVRPLPNLVINHIVLNGQTEPYCPTYGDLTIRAELVNPVAGQTVAPHAYVWTGESVNVMSDSARTWVTIVPEWCDTLYYPTVTVTDDRGCVNSVTDTIEVASDGPQVASLPDSTLVKQPGCTFIIPDFKDLMTSSIVTDDCYSFSRIKYADAYGTVERVDAQGKPTWYSQSPAAGDTLKTASAVVTITITNPCGKSGTATVNVLKPSNELAVTINPDSAADCQKQVELNGVEFTATVENNVGTPDYEWSLVGSTTPLTNNHQAMYKAIGAMAPGIYTYKVDVEDALGCTASATSVLTVYYQGATPITQEWPNDLCVRYNGRMAIYYAPTGYSYILQHNDYSFFHFFKMSDNPEHQTTEWNTINFDSLRPGYYTLTVTTNEGCSRDTTIFIDDVSAAPNAPTFTKVNVTVCTNDNGQLTINALSGFSYKLYNTDVDPMVLVGTATSYNNLPVGHYYIEATDNATKCKSSATFELIDQAQRPTITTNLTANTNCANNTSYNNNPNNVFNGQIKITSNANWQYTVYTAANDTLLNGVTLNSTNNPIKDLAPATYYIVAYDPSTGCYNATSNRSVTVGSNTTNPTISETITPNHYCAINTADGSITVTPSNHRLFALLKKQGYFSYDTIAPRSTNNSWSPLYDATYQIEVIGNNYCRSTKEVVVEKSTINPVLSATSTMNTSCVDELGTITVKNTNAAAMNVSTYGNAKIAKYTITKGAFTKDSLTNAAQVTFDHLASGTYTYTGITNYGCQSTPKTVEVEQYQLPAMQLDSTPNHMCARTYEKPGDGTVTVVVPTTDNVPGNHFFKYYFFDANDVNMDVPYELPLTNTKYWLAAKQYHVVAVDTITGCTVDGYITVENDFYTVDFDYTTTPNFICGTSAVGNGTITVVNPTSTNPDAVFAYSLDGITYQTDPTFTGLKDNTYDVYVKDTTMQCFLSKPVAVSATDSCAPMITISDGTNTGLQFDYCYGTTGIQLCGTVNDTCNPSNTYSYAWYAPCADPNSSNTNCIDVQTDHYVINGCDYIFTATNTTTGCSYSKTVNVAIHPNPVLVFTINGNPATTDQANWFCEDEPLHIAVHSQNPEVILDTNSINWTLGKIATGIAEFDTVGSAMINNAVTFCVRANSEFGCPSGNASLPVSIIRTDSVSVNDTACTKYITTTDATHPTAVTITPAAYPFDTVIVREYTKTVPVHGQYCDSVVTYNVHINAKPVMTPDALAPAAFCQDVDTTLADFASEFSINWNGDQTATHWMIADKSNVYTLVTSTSDLTDGLYVIADKDETVAMSNVTNSSNTSIEEAAFVTNNPSPNIIWTLTKNGNYYTIYNETAGKYVTLNSNENQASLTSATDGNKSLWTISVASTGVAQVTNRAYSSRRLQYNATSTGHIFRCYTGAQKDLKLYKLTPISGYRDTLATAVVDYDFASKYNVIYVAENCCGNDTSSLTFNVSKAPVIDSFQLKDSYCNNTSATITYKVSAFTALGNNATATLKIDGSTVKTTTVTGTEQTISYSFTPKHYLHDGKTVTLTLSNVNGLCNDTVATKTLHVDTTIYHITLDTTYCEGQIFNYSDFIGTGFNDPKSANLIPSGSILDGTAMSYATHNGKKVYFTMNDDCGNTVTSDTITLKVKGNPIVHALFTPMQVCDPGSSFTLTEPSIAWNGSDSITSGWLLEKNGVYQPTTFAEIRDSAICHTAQVAFFATGTCASDTSYSWVYLITPPTITLSISSQCPNVKVADAISSTPSSCDPNPATTYYSYQKSDGTGYVKVSSFGTKTFGDLLADGYNGGKISAVVKNNCGSDSVGVVLNIPVYAYDTFKLQSACNNTALENFIQTGTYDWKGTGVTITSTFWSVNGTEVNAGTYNVDATHTSLNVTYSYVTSCNDTVTTIAKDLKPFINDKPEVTLTPLADMCEGDTIKAADLLTNLTVNYIQPSTSAAYDTTWYIGADVLTLPHVVTYADSGRKVIVSINEKVANSTCGNTNDTIELVVNKRPDPTISGPTDTCADKLIQFVAEDGYINYVFNVVGQAMPYDFTTTGRVFESKFALSFFGNAHDSIYVTVEDPTTHCKGTSSNPAVVRITNTPTFIFKDSNNVETHEFSTTTGVGLQYTWMVGVDCYTSDKLVYVEYDIYHNDTLIANAKIGDYLSTQHYTEPGHPAKDYVTSNYFEWCATDGTPKSDRILYNYAMANPSFAQSGNHFPYSNLGLGTGHNYFDDLWLSFLADREVTKTYVPFLINGDYKVVYRLMATDNNSQLHEYYSPSCATITDLFPIGGHSSLAGGYTQTLLASDSITIHVGGTSLAPSTDPVTDETPEVAPALSVEETVAPDMEVWPNPAPAVETTLKARVHNMSGKATVTLTNLMGKQVYNGEIFIDNDNYYFEFNVNSLSVGSYIMTVRTDADVITKKVIVARLAK